MAAAVLDAVPVATAVLSPDGTIIHVNEAWRSFAEDNPGVAEGLGPGADYLSTCDRAAAAGDEPAACAARGVRAVLAGTMPDFSLEYSSHSSDEERWYLLTVRPLFDQGGAVVSHAVTTEANALRQRLKTAEDARRASESLLCEAVAAMSDGFALYDADGILLHCNARFLELLDMTSERIRPGIHLSELLRLLLDSGYFPEQRESGEELLRKRLDAFREAENEAVELQLSRDRWISTRVTAARNGLRVGIVSDISHEKRREAELEANKKRFSDFAESGAERFWELDENLRFVFAKMPEEDTGLSGDRLLGRSLREVAQKMRTLDDHWQALLADMEAHRPFRDFYFSLTDLKGRLRHFCANGVPVFDERRCFRGYRGVLTDETDIVEARLRAERAEAYLRAAFEMVPYGFVIYDRDERLVLCNSRYKEMYRMSEELTRPGTSFEATLRASLAKGLYLDAIGREEEWLGERLRKHRQPGGPFEQRLLDRWILVEEGRMPDGGSVGTRADITEVKRGAERSIEIERLQALGTLAGGIAHDFNNLLAAVIGFSELVLDEPGLTPEARSNLDQIMIAGRRGKELIKQILRFSRATDEGASEVCSIAVIAEEVLSMLRPAVHPDIELKLVAGEQDVRVQAVPAHLSQIVMNLAVNAAHAIGHQAGLVEISIEEVAVDARFAGCRPPLKAGPAALLIVRDDGAGMDETLVKRIFEPFFTTKQVGEGTGMGLSVVHGIVRGYEGAITVHSEVGIGSEFLVYLPLATDERTAGEETVTQLVDGRAEKALVVDDDPVVRRVVERLLARLGYEVVAVPDAQTALNALFEAPDAFSLVVTDQVMPKVSGHALAVSIRAAWPDLPILLCTGYGHGLDESQLVALGKTGLLIKPFTLHELSAALTRLLGRDPGTFPGGCPE